MDLEGRELMFHCHEGWVSAGRPASDAVCVQSGDSRVWLAQAKLQRVLLGKDAWEQP